ncbi:hypothetical protein ACIQNU_02480 [Streptomyces sp. NPDC091292]|uniref:hypothetical protein n=1 Tax=Streptomyces sp. NPDC091292 TaxID=3365991 RepID=UPI0038100217
MPWVKLDDRFPSHRKVALLSDRAFRLHVSALCWCAENLTDGCIAERELPLVAKVRAVKVTAKQLEDAGLWDRVDDGWQIHDYLEYNPSREQVLAERKRNAARQEAFRRRKNGKPIPPDGSDAPSNNGRSNGVTDASETHDNDTTATRTQHDGDTTAAGKCLVSETESQVSAFRHAVTNGAPTRPDPTPTPSSGSGRERSTGSSAQGDLPHSLINADWQPTTTDRAAAAADVRRLGSAGTANATAKFVRHHQTRATRAADFGPAWVTWLTRERAETPQQGAFLVGLPGGDQTTPTPTPPSYAQRMAELNARAEADRKRDRQHGDTA